MSPVYLPESKSDAMTDLARRERYLWAVAILFYGVGDVVTTFTGLWVDHVVEAGPIVAVLLQQYHVATLVGLKIVAFACFYGCWRIIPSPYSIGTPLSLAVMGVLVTIWNGLVVTTTVV